MIKWAANSISIIRILLTLMLFFLFQNSMLFLIVYLLCGLSDVLDGYIARKTKTASEFGARLDSVADFLFFGMIIIFLVFQWGQKLDTLLPWVGAAAIIRFINLGLAWYKYHTFASIHTWGNKMTGIMVFLTPFFTFYDQPMILWLTCIMSILSAVEETAIHITSSTLDINRSGYWNFRKKA